MKKSTVNQGLSRPSKHCRARKVIGWYDQWYGMIWLCRSIDQLILQFPYVPWRSMFAHISPLRLPICHVRCHQFRQASWRWCRSSQAQAVQGCHPGGPVPGSHLQHLPVPATASALEYPAVLGPNSTGTAPSRESQSLLGRLRMGTTEFSRDASAATVVLGWWPKKYGNLIKIGFDLKEKDGADPIVKQIPIFLTCQLAPSCKSSQVDCSTQFQPHLHEDVRKRQRNWHLDRALLKNCGDRPVPAFKTSRTFFKNPPEGSPDWFLNHLLTWIGPIMRLLKG